MIQTAALPPPRRIDSILRWKPLYCVAAGLALFPLQIASGTSPLFALLVFSFLLLTCLTVDTLGGPMRVVSFCVIFLAMQSVLVSQVAKIYYWQSADKPLKSPIETMLAMNLGMAGFWLAALTARKIGLGSRIRPLFATEKDPGALFRLAILCVVLSALQFGILVLTGTDDKTGHANTGGAFGWLRILTFMSPLAIVISTAYEITISQRRRSLGFLNGFAMLIAFCIGVLGASRQGTVQPFILYFLTCFAFQYRFRIWNWASLVFFIWAAYTILMPYGGYARKFVRTKNMSENISKAITLFPEIALNPEKYRKLIEKEQMHGDIKSRQYLYYGQPAGVLDRFSMIINTDAIVNATLRNGTTGMTTITPGFYLALPSYLAARYKFTINTGNYLAHRAPGLCNKNDYTTSITLGLLADPFSAYSWVGVFGISFIILLGYCFVFRTLIDDRIWSNVIALGFAFTYPYAFSEGSICSQIAFLIDGWPVLVVVVGVIKLLAVLTDPATIKPVLRPVPKLNEAPDTRDAAYSLRS